MSWAVAAGTPKDSTGRPHGKEAPVRAKRTRTGVPSPQRGRNGLALGLGAEPSPRGSADGTAETSVARFTRLVAPEIPALTRLARRLAAPSDADDLVQETLLRAYRAIGQFDGAHPRAWVCTILRNAWKNSVRTGQHIAFADERLLEQATPPAAQDGGEPSAARMLGPALIDGLTALPPSQHAVVTLVDLEGFTYRETADLLGLRLGTVMSQLHRARHTLRIRVIEHVIHAAAQAGIGLSGASVNLAAGGPWQGRTAPDDGLLDTFIQREPVILFAFDRDGIITYRRGHGLALLGQPPRAGVGMSAFDFHRGAPSVIRHVKRALTGESTLGIVEAGAVSFEVQQRCRLDEDGRLAGVVGVAFALRRRTRRQPQADTSGRTRA